eukprot:SAG11_NODE_191_length_12943_cov_3.853706_9_plen_517_part_00
MLQGKYGPGNLTAVPDVEDVQLTDHAGNPQTDQDPCVACPGGMFNENIGREVCDACPRGKYSLSGDTYRCTRCPIGRYASEQGTDFNCEDCPAGTGMKWYLEFSETKTSNVLRDEDNLGDPEAFEESQVKSPLRSYEAELDLSDDSDRRQWSAMAGADSQDDCLLCDIGRYYSRAEADPLIPENGGDDTGGHGVIPAPGPGSTCARGVPEGDGGSYGQAGALCDSCRACAPGRHADEVGMVFAVAPGCNKCSADESRPLNDKICGGGVCKAGRMGKSCALCVSKAQDFQIDPLTKQAVQDPDKCSRDAFEGFLRTSSAPVGAETQDACGIDGENHGGIGYFSRGGECELCGDPMISVVGVLGFLAVSTFVLTYTVVKGFTSEHAEQVQGGMDFTKSMGAIFGMLQRLTAVLTLPFGWPEWLRELCNYLGNFVAFDGPAIAAPECQATQTAAQTVYSRLAISALALPVVWLFIFFEMVRSRFRYSFFRAQLVRRSIMRPCLAVALYQEVHKNGEAEG